MNWPQENAKIAKKKRHNLFSLSSLRSFAAKTLLDCVISSYSGTDGEGNERRQVFLAALH
jgi:hypothetical protein